MAHDSLLIRVPPPLPRPSQIAGRLAARRDAVERQKHAAGIASAWRETYILSKKQAVSKAREWIDRRGRSAYVTEVENWRDLGDGRIECTVRRVAAD